MASGNDEAPHVLVPAELAVRVARDAGAWGSMRLRYSKPENLLVLSSLRDSKNVGLPFRDEALESHFTRHHSDSVEGLWYRVDPELHDLWYWLHLQHCATPLDELRKRIIPNAWMHPPRHAPWLLITVSDPSQPSWISAWWVDSTSAQPSTLDTISAIDPLHSIEQQWPVATLRSRHVVMVGTGSIGSAAASSLAASGVGTLSLVDPQRLEHHNVARHMCSTSDVGKYKVHAVAQLLSERFPSTVVHPIVGDVERDADSMRPLFAAADLIVTASDGVLSRQVANHLARRAGKPIVFAAVLEDGAFGEVIRCRPQDACLRCLRDNLVENGSLDPEPALDADYGTGTRHRPMTAAPPDLRLIGELAAKVALATLLERAGFSTQRLPGGWLLVGLQPDQTFASPFDLTRAGETKWLQLPAPRKDCISCARRQSR